MKKQKKAEEYLQGSSTVYSVAKADGNPSSHPVKRALYIWEYWSQQFSALKGQFLGKKSPKSSRKRRKFLGSLKAILLQILKGQDRGLIFPAVDSWSWC